jgi:hypothetical protein
MPAAVVFTIVGLVVCRRLAQALETRPFVAWLLVVSLGVIASATITPLRGMFDTTPPGPETCDFSVLGPIPVRDLFRVNDRLLNVILFFPLGLALGLLPRGRRTAVLVVGALLLPFAIEITQLAVHVLGRGCQSVDLIDNLTGLVLGLAAGAVIGRVAPGAAGRAHPGRSREPAGPQP